MVQWLSALQLVLATGTAFAGRLLNDANSVVIDFKRFDLQGSVSGGRVCGPDAINCQSIIRNITSRNQHLS